MTIPIKDQDQDAEGEETFKIELCPTDGGLDDSVVSTNTLTVTIKDKVLACYPKYQKKP